MKILKLNPFSGEFTINEVTEPIYQYQVFIDLFNSKIWSNFKSDYIAELTIFGDESISQEKETDSKIIDQKPKQNSLICDPSTVAGFESPLPSSPIKLDFSQNQTITYSLPPTNSCVNTIDVLGSKPYVSFNQNKKELIID